ncbi:substrate-binding domain-containing protein [Amnibacterium endophyticum]|uniref:Substrate-binding domain-containing protein n=1 Tax=Amnibacterium endophyticum TaxID=2109337 RepID=A0ABW4LHY6_9MICO
MATIFDVARAAQVSHQTVSRVLKGDPTVGAPLRERVEQAVRELRYRPSAAARALASRRTRTLGMITVGQPYYGPSSTAQGFNAAARGAGWDVSIEALEDPDGADLPEAVAALRSRDVQAVVVVAPTPEVRAATLQVPDRDVPFVMAGGGDDGFAGVALDQRAGAVAATRHLTDLGHRRVALLAGPAHWADAADREDGWRAALAEAGVEPGPLVRGDWSAASGAAAAEALRDAGATAVFCANDQMALGLLHALHRSGLRVPEDVSVVGFDDIPEAAFFTPALTTVGQDFAALGRALLGEVERLVAGGETPPALAAPRLVVRDSTAPPR